MKSMVYVHVLHLQDHLKTAMGVVGVGDQALFQASCHPRFNHTAAPCVRACSRYFSLSALIQDAILFEQRVLFFKYILLIMLLPLSHFFLPLSLLHLVLPFPPAVPPHLSSCPWVTHISSLASPFPMLFLTSLCLFCAYHLCFLFPAPFPPILPISLPLITLCVISISMNLFLF